MATDFEDRSAPDRATHTAITPEQLAALQRRLVREQPADPRDVGGLKLPVPRDTTPPGPPE